MDVAQVVHLAGRFVSSCRPGAPKAIELGWVQKQLSPTELALWERMSNPDQRHSVAVAQAVAERLPAAPAWVVAAALLHDVGKVDSGLRTPSRVIATLFWGVTPSERALEWSDAPGVRGRFARYHLHPAIGAELCEAAGSHSATSAWAREHHFDDSQWSTPHPFGAILKACDND